MPLRREQERRAVLHEKAVAVQELVDIEHDRQAGMLAKEDYAVQRKAAEARAIATLKALDRLMDPLETDPIERLIRLERERIERGER